MEKVTIEAKIRQEGETVKKIRKEGKIPAIVYGKETKTVPIEIKIKDIEKTVKTLKEGLLLITLKLIDNAEEKTVVIQEIQRDPVTDNIIHADFRQISLKEKSVFKVPVVPVGIAEGVKVGGVLEHIMREIQVKCLPDNLPNKIELDITNLKIGQDIKVKDIKLKEEVEIIEDKDKVVLTIIAPHKEEEVKPEAALAVPTEPELIRKEKAAEEGEEAQEGKEAKEAKQEKE